MTNDIKAPETKGFVGGKFYGDNSNVYVGYGNFPGPNCISQNPAPGYISTNSSAPGAYMSCNNLDRYDKSSAFYLVNSSDLQWVQCNVNNMLNILGILKINSYYNFLFARVWMNGIYYIGKLNSAVAGPTLWTTTATGEKSFYGGFEVLACSKTKIETPCGKFYFSLI